MSLRSVNYGGGVQSTSLLVLAAQGRIDFKTFLFANVGDDSEHPATLQYVRNVAMPYAAEHGIDLHELHRVRRDGADETLYGRMTREGSNALPIPVRLQSGAPASRSCTVDFKVKVIGKWLKEHGATPDDPATVAIGISVDEIQRANQNRNREPYETIVYPLLDLRMRRSDCMTLIHEAGLPVPPKSACWFCPFHSRVAWRDMRTDEPELFDKAAELERFLRERSIRRGHGPVWMTDRLVPLEDAISSGEERLPLGTEGCDGGYCWL